MPQATLPRNTSEYPLHILSTTHFTENETKGLRTEYLDATLPNIKIIYTHNNMPWEPCYLRRPFYGTTLH